MKKTPVIWRVLLGVVLCALIVFAYARPCFSRGECAALIALGQRGKPYVFGKEGPDVFDCSGIVRYCYTLLGTDVIHSAGELARAAGEGDPRGITKDASERLTAGLARAAGIDLVADAAARSYRLRAGRHTGWIATRWLTRLRKDPLKRLHIESHDKHSDPGVHRTSLPPMNASQKAELV